MIAKSWFDWCWQWQIGGGVAIFGTLLVGGGEIVNAQIVPDNTLGAERSAVTRNVNIRGIPSDQIDGGAIRGANLFHSFEQLSVLEGRGAYFTNPAGISNILSRVTGANRSEINGRLGVDGNANLFLINPNGIVFGPSASLDVQGSFLATTANAVKLGDTGLFSASQPATSNLLSVSPSALWFNAVAAQPIVNRSQAPSLINQPNSGGLPPGLQVQPGRTLALVGGDVFLKSGRLTAAGGRIELGSVAGVGEVSLSSSGNNFVLGYDSINNFGNISLSNGAFVDASGEGGGDVQIRGGRFSMTQSSNIWANTLGAENGKQVLVRATEVELSEGSYLRANVTDTGTGIGGDIRIDTGRLLVRDGAVVSATTYGSGNGGSLQITALEKVEVIGTSASGQFIGGLFTSSSGSGDAGDLRIDTGRLLVRDGAQVSTGTDGAGNGGSLQITAAESVELIGTSADGGFGSGLSARSKGSGEAGDLTINTGRLLVRDGALVSTGTSDRGGKGGSLQITAADSVEVIGTSASGSGDSSLSASSFESGDAGDLSINTGRLLVSDGAGVSAGSVGSGKSGSLQITATDSVEVIGTSASGSGGSSLSASSVGSAGAGDLSINTRRLLVSDGARVSVNTFGSGKSGSLQIMAADSVEVVGESTANGFNSSELSARNTNSASGEGGDLSINTRRLVVRDGAEVSVDAFGSGSGGSLQITATDSVEVIGGESTANGFNSSGLFARNSNYSGSGDAGILRIDTGRLLVRDGAQVSAGTFGSGKGGSLQIRATDWVALIGSSADGQVISGLVTSGSGSGDAGDLSINTGRLLVRDGAQVSAGTSGSGKGGSLQIMAADSVEVIGESTANGFNSSGLFARNSSSGSGDAGDLSINTRRLLVRDGAEVSAGTFGSGKGGSLQITASDSVKVIGTSALIPGISGLFTSSQGSGDSGDLSINTGRLLVRDGARVSAGTFSSGNGGSLQIKVRDSVEVIGTSANGQSTSGLLAQSYGTGDAGDLTINTGRLLVRDGAEVSATTFVAGNGGSLQIMATDLVELIGRSVDGQFGSGLFADSQGSGDAGNLSINTGRLLVRDGAAVSAATRGSGNGGNLQITTADSVEVIGRSADGQRGSRLFADTGGSGNAGNLSINTGRLLVRDGAQVSAGTRGSGNGGSFQITATDSVEVIGTSANGRVSGLFTPSEGSGDAGNLSINTGRLLVGDGAQVSSYSTREGTAGNINITARDTLQANNGRISTTSVRSSGGSIDIKASNIRLSGNSDITSTVNSGAGGGGNIDIKADSIIAFNDSDIFAFARDGKGGNITLDTRVFFGESYRSVPRSTDPRTLDRNNRVDINATGNLASGTIALPNTTSIQNSLTELPENRINTDSLLASSCIVRRDRPTRGSFTVTGTGGLPQRPGDVQMSDFPTVDVETLPSDTTSSNTNPNRSWQKGDPIVEPQGVYRLPNGKLVMSRECY